MRLREIITLRAIALKRLSRGDKQTLVGLRDHNATSYSTETVVLPRLPERFG